MKASEAIRPTVAAVADLLRSQGYRKRGNRFNRRLPDDGVLHVISFQLATNRGFEPMEEKVVWGHHYYGTFTVNIGVFAPALGELSSSSDFVADWDCPIRKRNRRAAGSTAGHLVAGRLPRRWRRRRGRGP